MICKSTCKVYAHYEQHQAPNEKFPKLPEVQILIPHYYQQHDHS